ncbi:MAG: Ni/Fe hydrogenase subunit alpha, partial [Deltaproteobacteria bacterium]|nr:Ni/Fe hydrogenase subunit alpha [Deltaproteobacteria bacterium]
TIEHSQWLLDNGMKEEDRGFTVREGRGVGAVDVPRGTLFHDYTYDGKGKCVEANLVIPTNQNHANIQADMEDLVPLIRDMPGEKMNLTLEMLVRAYDPCISCSTHCVDLRSA